MAGWIMTENPEYAGVHNNSGEFTYGQTLCPGTPSDCSPYVSYSVKANIEEGADFDSFTGTCGNISKALAATGCNEEMLVMWFNEGTNKSYNSVLDDNSIVDIKNVDECEHIIISESGIREGGQNFEDASYKDSGYPSIATNPCSSTISGGKYVAGTEYNGHKIKYHVISDTIPSLWYTGHTELVEIYFPHLYGSGTKEGKNTKVIDTAAFSGSTRLSAITFSAVEDIRASAFTNCYSLKAVDWGHISCCSSKIEHIGEFAFFHCENIEILCLNKLSKIKNIDQGAFAYCEKCKTINLPTNSEFSALTVGVFAYCNRLSGVTIPSNIKIIDTAAFNSIGYSIDPQTTQGVCPKVVIPNSVKQIGAYAFDHHFVLGLDVYVNWSYSSDTSHNVTLKSSDGSVVQLDPTCFGDPAAGDLSSSNKATVYVSDELTKTAYELYFNQKGFTTVTVAVGTP